MNALGSSSSAAATSGAESPESAFVAVAPRPRLSFGLPVYNGQRSLARLIESIQRQTFEDFELVISDNHSTDDTAQIVAARAGDDPRIRFFPRPANAGIVANFNRALELSSGEYFRWIGADDWLEPSYAEKCVALLDRHPEAIGVTTFQAHWSAHGDRHYLEYQGRRVDSAQPHERFIRCLWLMNEDFRYFDPMYSMHRRRVLERTRGLRPILNGDQMLAVELSLLGPYVHVPECLAHRGIPRASRSAVLELLRPPGRGPVNPAPEQFLCVLHELLGSAAIGLPQKLAAYPAIVRYYLEEFEMTRLRPVRVRVSRRLRELGIPVERWSPFSRPRPWP
jgi:hypothetical protein